MGGTMSQPVPAGAAKTPARAETQGTIADHAAIERNLYIAMGGWRNRSAPRHSQRRPPVRGCREKLRQHTTPKPRATNGVGIAKTLPAASAAEDRFQNPR